MTPRRQNRNANRAHCSSISALSSKTPPTRHGRSRPPCRSNSSITPERCAYEFGTRENRRPHLAARPPVPPLTGKTCSLHLEKYHSTNLAMASRPKAVFPSIQSAPRPPLPADLQSEMLPLAYRDPAAEKIADRRRGHLFPKITDYSEPKNLITLVTTVGLPMNPCTR